MHKLVTTDNTVQHVTVLNTVGNCNTMGPLSYMRSIVDRNVVMGRIPVFVIS